ncbi:glycosyl hydrolase [Moelleriella libera RCEF 2490]|uniref:alpha-1,2-Mannosidase n=1 Tax=Moelleriella libera RCEF 2490 TaxID=1081109 RepID=A0A168EWS6_9HYPO|nr:glycosyl hydrolase [Moelleriella libera RCEF 2490]
MITLGRRRIVSVLLSVFVLLTVWRAWELTDTTTSKAPAKPPKTGFTKYEPEKDYFWRTIRHNFPVTSFRPLPTAAVDSLPRVQAKSFPAESSAEKEVRLTRRRDVKDSFLKSWSSYKKHAWLHDELTPVSGGAKDTFGGWGATLIDSLDTLYMMGLKDEFDEAVAAVAKNAVFLSTRDKQINVFETTIRFLGGLLSAYDLSGDKRLLAKAHNVGDMLYKAFDTPNHLPVTRWDLHEAARGRQQQASGTTLLAEIGSLSLEFTRLSLVTRDPKYYDAVQHIGELLADAQPKSKIPGLWPVVVDAAKEYFDAGATYTLGGMADSTYEYIPKMMALLGHKATSAGSIYAAMYNQSVAAAAEFLFFRPMTPDADDILFPGFVDMDGNDASRRKAHDAGGAAGQAGKSAAAIIEQDHLPPSFTIVTDPRYLLRPEAIESIFIMYRVTGDRAWQDKAWAMWKAIDNLTSTKLANSAVRDMNPRDEAAGAAGGTELMDSMESFWLGETLKYFYLIFSDPELVSLDESKHPRAREVGVNGA